MTTQRGKHIDHARMRGGRWPLCGAASVALVALIGLASPNAAKAGDDFERGFKRELGAIAAHEVVGIGKHIIGGAIAGPYGYRHPGYYGRHHRRSYYARPYRHGYRRYTSPHYDHPRPRRHYRPRVVHEHYHYYGDDCY